VGNRRYSSGALCFLFSGGVRVVKLRWVKRSVRSRVKFGHCSPVSKEVSLGQGVRQPGRVKFGSRELSSEQSFEQNFYGPEVLSFLLLWESTPASTFLQRPISATSLSNFPYELLARVRLASVLLARVYYQPLPFSLLEGVLVF